MNDMLQRQRWFATRHLHFLSAVGLSVLFALTMCGTALGQEPAAQIEVSGKVTTPEGHPISGVAVRVRGSATSTATDAQGSYTISAPGDGVLTFNLIGFRGTAEPDEVERQDPIPRSRDRVAPLRIGGGTGRAPPDADGHAGNGMTLRRGDFAGDLDLRRWLLAQCSSAHGQGEQHTQPHRAEEVEMPGREPTLTLQHVVHGAALFLRAVAWP